MPIIQGEHRKQRVRTNLFCRIQLIDQPAFDITKIILNCKPLTFKRLKRPEHLKRSNRTPNP